MEAHASTDSFPARCAADRRAVSSRTASASRSSAPPRLAFRIPIVPAARCRCSSAPAIPGCRSPSSGRTTLPCPWPASSRGTPPAWVRCVPTPLTAAPDPLEQVSICTRSASSATVRRCGRCPATLRSPGPLPAWCYALPRPPWRCSKRYPRRLAPPSRC
jgi:hypothetical protein